MSETEMTADSVANAFDALDMAFREKLTDRSVPLSQLGTLIEYSRATAALRENYVAGRTATGKDATKEPGRRGRKPGTKNGEGQAAQAAAAAAANGEAAGPTETQVETAAPTGRSSRRGGAPNE